MNGCRNLPRGTRQARTGLGLTLTAAIVMMLGHAAAVWAGETAPALAEEDVGCLKCHGQPGYAGKDGARAPRPLHVAEAAFAASVHANDGCAACHSEEGEECLDKDGSAYASRREHSIRQMKGCVDCHKAAVKGYERSVHAGLLKDADAGKADQTAVCSDCHDLHAERFFEAGNKCTSCHEEATRQHRDWLPKTDRHLATVACEVCHAPDARRRVTLRIYQGEAPAVAASGVPVFRNTADPAQPAGLDARAVWSLLDGLSRQGAEGSLALRGRLELRSAAEGHAVADSAKAIKDCNVCHREGADAFDSVTVSIIGADGKPVHAVADKAILSSLESLTSVGGFYVLGATRMKLLDQLLLLTAVGGAGIPLGHLSLRALAGWLRKRRAARDQKGE